MEAKINIPITYNQLFQLVRQLPVIEKQKLLASLIKESFSKPDDDTLFTHFASEKALAKDWLSPEEDNAWKDL
ncbi:MAG: hypothetical protein LLG13_04535 [Bacteroidales bacterium]|nr:hypothetical protein [Bacteroidales bacterium]